MPSARMKAAPAKKQRRTPDTRLRGDIAQEIFEEPEGEQSRLCSWIRAGLPNWRRARCAPPGVQPLRDGTHRQPLDMEFDLIADVVAAEQSAERSLSFLNTSASIRMAEMAPAMDVHRSVSR